LQCGDKSYVFPKADVAPLPIANTTAELLAEWLAGEVAATLARAGIHHIRRYLVDVEEMPGQAAGFVLDSKTS
jgi:6-pyruvoyltetrahydropterin/6-carboxytetrahydropterin synthase